ncbi:MAG: hypothetical protein KAY31_00225 [Flavobacterium sp.]|nr:hypothetical protein [Flavobacterium sp.]
MENGEKAKLTLVLEVLYVLVTLVVVFGEFQKDSELLAYSKPFVIPVLSLVYILRTKRRNYLYLLALFFGWLANIFFIKQTGTAIFNGGMSYLLFWVVMTYIVLVNTKFPNVKLFTIAIIPFMFIFTYILQLIYINIYGSVYLYFLNAVFMVFLGGYSLSAYFLHSDRVNTYLLIAVLLFTFIQFIISIDLYYLSFSLFRPIAFTIFAVAQMILLRLMVLFDIQQIEVRQ